MFNWAVILAAVFFVAAILMLIVAFRLPENTRTGGRMNFQEQAILYTALFMAAGVIFLVISIFY